VGAVRSVAPFAKVVSEIAVWSSERDVGVVKRQFVGTLHLVVINIVCLNASGLPHLVNKPRLVRGKDVIRQGYVYTSSATVCPSVTICDNPNTITYTRIPIN
jgi:hypothetical protein